MNKIKVLSLFSGIGAFEKALTNANIDFELVGFSEIDKYAIESYCALHNINKRLNLGDVSKVDFNNIEDFDLMTSCGFPCQDISIAGRQQGFTEDSDTRSSLLWEAMKIAKKKKPKYMVAENVKNLVGKKFKGDFDKWISVLDEIGYNTYYDVLNAKDFGIPQNRERVFVVSIRKDIDNGNFKFPIGEDLGVRLKDLLEEKIEDRYYLSEEVQKRFKFNEKYHKNIIGTTAPEFRTIGQRDLVYKTEGVMGALIATDYKQPKQIIEMYVNEIDVVGNLDIKGMDCIKRVYHPNGVSPTLTTMEGGNRQPKVIEENELTFVGGIGDKDWVGDGKQLSRNYPQGNRVYDSEGIVCSQTANGGGIGGKTGLYLTCGAIRGRYNEQNKIEQNLELKNDDIVNTLKTVQKDNVVIEERPFRIRKLTPLECWRLMGFTDDDFNKAKSSLNNTYYKGKDRSDSQLYKQAGNSIVVNVVEELFKNLLKIK